MGSTSFIAIHNALYSAFIVDVAKSVCNFLDQIKDGLQYK